jgi:hypothetical protein
MASNELKQPLGASIIRALGLAESDIPKFILADLEREWDKSAFFTIYTTFSNPICATSGAGGGDKRSGDSGSDSTDEKSCCKYEALSTSPAEKGHVSIKVSAPGWGNLAVSGSSSVRPHIVNEAHLKPEGDCPGRCQDETLQAVIELIYHFGLHFKLELLGSGMSVGAQFKYPPNAAPTAFGASSAAIEVEFDWEGDTHDSLRVFANCATITTNNKDKRPWLDSLPGGSSTGGPIYKPHPAGHAPLGLGNCAAKVTATLLGFTLSGRGGRVTIDTTPSVGGVPQSPPQAAFPLSATGAVTPQTFTVWSGDVPNGCDSWFEVNAVFDLKLFDRANQKIADETVKIKEMVFCPDDDKTQFVRQVIFQNRAHLLLYVRVDLAC